MSSSSGATFDEAEPDLNRTCSNLKNPALAGDKGTVDYLGKHFRSDEDNPTRRLFLKRSLAAATGLIGFKILDSSEVPKAGGYGSSPYGGKS
jgi:hypothetical protein